MFDIFLYILIIGFLPGLLWLFFWLREGEDDKPEPKYLILKTFFYSWIGVVFVKIAQTVAISIFDKNIQPFVFVALEELVKFLIVYKVALTKKANNERTDPILYLIIGAIGFATLENILYLISYLLKYGLYKSFGVVFFRYVGATIIHIVSTGLIGFFMSLTYYKKKSIRIIFLHIGFFLAVFVHYNFNILSSSKNPEILHQAFYLSWALLGLILILFEYIKYKENYIDKILIKKKNEK